MKLHVKSQIVMYVNGKPSLHIHLRNVFIHCTKQLNHHLYIPFIVMYKQLNLVPIIGSCTGRAAGRAGQGFYDILRAGPGANSFFPNDIAVAPPIMSVIRIRAFVIARSCIRRNKAPCAYKKLQTSIIIKSYNIMKHLNVVNKKQLWTFSMMESLVGGREIKTLITKLIFFSDIISRRFFAGVCF